MQKAIIQRPLLKDQLKGSACFPMPFRALTQGQKFPHPLLCALPRSKEPRHHIAPATMKENTEVTATNHFRGKWEFKGATGLQSERVGKFQQQKGKRGKKEKKRLPQVRQIKRAAPLPGPLELQMPGTRKRQNPLTRCKPASASRPREPERVYRPDFRLQAKAAAEMLNS